MLKLRYEIQNQKRFEKISRKLKKKVEKLSNASEVLESLINILFGDNDDYLLSYIDSAIEVMSEYPNTRRTRKIESLLKEIQNIVYGDIYMDDMWKICEEGA